MTAKRTLFLSALAGVHLFSAILAASTPAPAAPQPELPPSLRDLPKDRPYALRVLYLEDGRLPTLVSEQRSELYSKIERLLMDWYGYQVKLREFGHQNLADFFSAHDELFAQHAATIRRVDIDVSNSAGQIKLRGAIARDFRAREISQIERYLHAGPLTSKDNAVEYAANQFMRQLSELREIPLADGTPFFDPAQRRLNSYPHWALLLEKTTEADVVFTNTMVVGADAGMPIYVIGRGGLTTAITDNNDRSPYQAAMMVGLFPFLSDAPVFLRERGRIPQRELLDVITTLCMHEMGHFFLRYAEHYDHPHCVHVAPVGLNYYEWHKSIRADGPCLLEHRKTKRF